MVTAVSNQILIPEGQTFMMKSTKCPKCKGTLGLRSLGQEFDSQRLGVSCINCGLSKEFTVPGTPNWKPVPDSTLVKEFERFPISGPRQRQAIDTYQCARCNSYIPLGETFCSTCQVTPREVKLSCSSCGSEFLREGKAFRDSARRGAEEFFCNTECAKSKDKLYLDKNDRNAAYRARHRNRVRTHNSEYSKANREKINTRARERYQLSKVK